VTGKDTAKGFVGCAMMSEHPSLKNHSPEYECNLRPKKMTAFVGKTVGNDTDYMGVPSRDVVVGTPVVK